MLIFRLSGGFGNQLWSYAAAYSLAKDRNEEFLMDTSTQEAKWFFRNLELEYYNVPIDNRICYKLGDSKLDHLFFNHWHRRMSLGLFTPTIYENKKGYDPSVFEKKHKIAYYVGDWQRLQYFEKYESDIRKMYIYKEELSDGGKEWKNKIRGVENSVAVHVRRGDYVRIGIALDEKFYRESVKYMAENFGYKVFFCFSEDLDWVREALKDLPYEFYYVEYMAEHKNLEDFELMRLCNHQIISRSTYSWWAAYLNDYKDKKVIFPEQGIEKDRVTWSKEWISISID